MYKENKYKKIKNIKIAGKLIKTNYFLIDKEIIKLTIFYKHEQKKKYMS